MQFKVPQNIDMQDRIIGPLTLSQFFYLLFGGLIIYILFSRLLINGFGFLFWILSIPIGVFSFCMAFVKIQDRPFPVFFMAMLRYLSQPRARVWQHYSPPVSAAPPPTKKKEATPTKKQLDPIRVNELVNVLDQPQEKR